VVVGGGSIPPHPIPAIEQASVGFAQPTKLSHVVVSLTLTDVGSAPRLHPFRPAQSSVVFLNVVPIARQTKSREPQNPSHGLKPQIGHNIDFQAISTRSASALSRA